MTDKVYGGLTIESDAAGEFAVFFEKWKGDPDRVKLGSLVFEDDVERPWRARSVHGAWTLMPSKWDAADWLLFVWNDRRDEHHGAPRLTQAVEIGGYVLEKETVYTLSVDGEAEYLGKSEMPVATTAGGGGAFWCECAKPDWDNAVCVQSGHSLDVMCGRCGRYLQVG